MPVASLLLPLLKPLLRVIRSVLALLPVLLRPPPMAPRLSPLALPRPPFVQRLALFASRPLASLATLSNHPRPPQRAAQRRAPGLVGPTRSQSSCPTAPQTPPNSTLPLTAGMPVETGIQSSGNPPQTPPKSAPRPPKSFF